MFTHRLGRRPKAVIAVLMALFLLAVSQLTPGNARDRFGPSVDSPVVVAVQKACGYEQTGDRMPSDGRHQSDIRAAAPAPQARPPADTAGILLPDLRTLPALLGLPAIPADAAPLPGVEPAQPGVLRI